MRTYSVTDNTLLSLLLQLAGFVVRRLQGRPEAAALMSGLRAARDQARADQFALEEASEATMCGTAELVYADSLLDEAVARFVRNLLAALDGDRQHPDFLRLFPVNPSEMTAGMATHEQSVGVSAMLVTFGGLTGLSHLAPYAAEVKEALHHVDQARAQRDTLERAERIIEGELAVSRQALVAAYNAAYHELNRIYPGQKSLVQSFYLNRVRSKSSGVNTSE